MESVGFRGSCLPNRAHKGVVTHQYIIEISLPTPMLTYPFRFFFFFFEMLEISKKRHGKEEMRTAPCQLLPKDKSV